MTTKAQLDAAADATVARYRGVRQPDLQLPIPRTGMGLVALLIAVAIGLFLAWVAA